MSGRTPGRLGLALVLALACACLGTPPAGAAVYWGAGGSIGAANSDGTMAMGSYPYENANTIPRAQVTGVAVNATNLFWSDVGNRAIGSMTLSNTLDGQVAWNEPRVSIDQALVPNVERPWGIALGPAHVYWASTAGAIGRANLDGSSADRSFIGGLDSPCGVAVDGAYVYWGEYGPQAIGRARLDGSEVEPEFITGAGDPCGIAVGGGYLYWSTEGSIGRARIDGSDPDPAFIRPAGRPCGVAVDATHVYWTNQFEPGIYASRANLDGSAAAPLVRSPFYQGSCGIALDSRVFQPRPPPLSQPIRFGQVERRKRGRLLVLPVYVPEQGDLRLSSPRIGWRVEKGPLTTPRWTLKVWPGKGRAGDRVRRQLRNKGRAAVVLDFSWEHGGRQPVSVTKRVTFLALGGEAVRRRR